MSWAPRHWELHFTCTVGQVCHTILFRQQGFPEMGAYNFVQPLLFVWLHEIRLFQYGISVLSLLPSIPQSIIHRTVVNDNYV